MCTARAINLEACQASGRSASTSSRTEEERTAAGPKRLTIGRIPLSITVDGDLFLVEGFCRGSALVPPGSQLHVPHVTPQTNAFFAASVRMN